MARSITTRSTNPKIMDDNIKILDDALAEASTPPAEDVSYDNSDSGLTATNVQEAIDEIVGSTVLATSTGSKTHAEHIGVLKAVWDTLSNNQKIKCKILRGNTIYYPTDIASGAGRFSMMIIDNQNMYIEMIRMSNTSLSVVNGTTYQDLSSQTADQSYTLFI